MRSWPLFLLLAAGCTQDFDAFNPVPSGSGGAGASAAGGSGAVGAGGSGATGATGATGGTGGVGGMPGGFGGTGDEDCTNAVDDDMDGDVDCADSDCTPLFDCAPEIPVGWDGPLALGAGAAAIACDGAYNMLALEGFAGLMFGPATCSACACAPGAVTCTPGAIQRFTTAACDMGTEEGSAIAQGSSSCNNTDDPGGTVGVEIAPPTASAPDCAPSGGAPTVGAITWSTVGTACSTDLTVGGGCTAGDVCVPKTPGTFGTTQCVSQSGDQSCPPGYPTKGVFHLAVDDYVDTRDCTACGCEDPVATCTGETSFHTNNNCPGSGTVVANDGACAALDGWSSRDFDTLTSSASCPTNGGAPTGTVTEGNNVVTVCCSS